MPQIHVSADLSEEMVNQSFKANLSHILSKLMRISATGIFNLKPWPYSRNIKGGSTNSIIFRIA